jgi:hypothetical protein
MARMGHAGNDPAVGNAAAALGALLDSLGIVASSTREGVEEAVADYLADKGLQAHVQQLRWGTLTLTADPQTARLLGFETDALLRWVQGRFGEQVQAVTVRTERSGRRRRF